MLDSIITVIVGLHNNTYTYNRPLRNAAGVMWDKIQFVYVWLPYCVTNFGPESYIEIHFKRKK